MKFSIKYKIFLLVAFVLFIAMTVSSLVYLNHTKKFAKSSAYKDLSHDVNVLITHINTVQNEVDELIGKVLNNENIVMSLNLISNYQDKGSYDKLVFNPEKRKILDSIGNLLGKDNSWSLAFFDKDGEIIAFKRKKKGRIVFGYSSFDFGDISLYDKNNKKLKNFKPKKLDLSILNKNDIFSRKNEFVLKKAMPIKNESEIIGYVRVGIVINNKNYYKLSNGTSNKSMLLSSSLVIGSKAIKVDYENIINKEPRSLLEKDKYFMAFDILKNVEDIVVLAYSDTKEIDKFIYKTLKDLTFIFLILMALLLIITLIFSKYFINTPLNELLEGIKKLKTNKGEKININTSDEIEILAKEFNEISSELSRSFKNLKTSNLFLENILDTVHKSIFIKDVEGVYIKGNKNFLNDCGFENELELIGKTDFDIWDKEDALKYQKTDNEIVETLSPSLNYEENQKRKNGDELIILTSKMPLIDNDGVIIGVLGIYEDITMEKLKEKRIKEKEAYLFQQSRLAQMGEMISMIAHQWRQPLTAISSTANGLILKNAMGKYEKEYFHERLTNIGEYSQHLSSTIDDFRNFFKKNKEKKEIKLEVVAEDSLKITQTSMENKNIKIVKEFECNESVFSFPNELRQVVLNLLKNAEDVLLEKDIKDKQITIKTYKMGDKKVIEISDNAGGVPENIIHEIFKPYYSTKENKDGTGLGLYMSKSIIEDHCQGKLTVKNNEFGATFKVII